MKLQTEIRSEIAKLKLPRMPPARAQPRRGRCRRTSDLDEWRRERRPSRTTRALHSSSPALTYPHHRSPDGANKLTTTTPNVCVCNGSGAAACNGPAFAWRMAMALAASHFVAEVEARSSGVCVLGGQPWVSVEAGCEYTARAAPAQRRAHGGEHGIWRQAADALGAAGSRPALPGRKEEAAECGCVEKGPTLDTGEELLGQPVSRDVAR